MNANVFGTVKKLVGLYGGFSVAVLVGVVGLAATGHEVTSLMWGRGVGMFASALVAYFFTDRAARGARWAYLRVRVIAILVPIALVVIDIVGGLPMWFIVMQVMGALALLPVAFILGRADVRAAFPKS